MKLDSFNTASNQERQAYFLPKEIGLGVGPSQQIGMTMKGCLWGRVWGLGQARKHYQDIEEDVMVSTVRGSMPLSCLGVVLKVFFTSLLVHDPAHTFTNKLKSLL